MLKTLVAVVCVIETLHTAFCIDFIYAYLITNFGDASTLDRIYWSVGVTVILGVLVSGVAHAFYIRRVWIMSKHNIPLTLLLIGLALLRFSFGMTTSSLLYTIPIWNKFHTEKLPLTTLAGGLSSAAAVDLIVATSLIIFLDHGRTGVERSDSRINLLMVYTINTGLITSIVSVAILITYAAFRSKLVFMGLVEIQSKLYANSLLASLNARSHIMKHGKVTDFTTGLETGPAIHDLQNWRAPPGAATQISVFQETVQTVDELPIDHMDKKRRRSLMNDP